ncbi:unnamed protein product [Pedinophyceae sp. YPF-701]|nr:unnamed protein product [Pedinophyceae sp. YPF-701]
MKRHRTSGGGIGPSSPFVPEHIKRPARLTGESLRLSLEVPSALDAAGSAPFGRKVVSEIDDSGTVPHSAKGPSPSRPFPGFGGDLPSARVEPAGAPAPAFAFNGKFASRTPARELTISPHDGTVPFGSPLDYLTPTGDPSPACAGLGARKRAPLVSAENHQPGRLVATSSDAARADAETRRRIKWTGWQAGDVPEAGAEPVVAEGPLPPTVRSRVLAERTARCSDPLALGGGASAAALLAAKAVPRTPGGLAGAVPTSRFSGQRVDSGTAANLAQAMANLEAGSCGDRDASRATGAQHAPDTDGDAPMLLAEGEAESPERPDAILAPGPADAHLARHRTTSGCQSAHQPGGGVIGAGVGVGVGVGMCVGDPDGMVCDGDVGEPGRCADASAHEPGRVASSSMTETSPEKPETPRGVFSLHAFPRWTPARLRRSSNHFLSPGAVLHARTPSMGAASDEGSDGFRINRSRQYERDGVSPSPLAAVTPGSGSGAPLQRAGSTPSPMDLIRRAARRHSVGSMDDSPALPADSVGTVGTAERACAGAARRRAARKKGAGLDDELSEAERARLFQELVAHRQQQAAAAPASTVVTGPSAAPIAVPDDFRSPEPAPLMCRVPQSQIRPSDGRIARQVAGRAKRLVIIRHGESEYNHAINHSREWADPIMFDPDLTDRGLQQCAKLREELTKEAAIPPDALWVCSPLTRAVQTMLRILDVVPESAVPRRTHQPSNQHDRNREPLYPEPCCACHPANAQADADMPDAADADEVADAEEVAPPAQRPPRPPGKPPLARMKSLGHSARGLGGGSHSARETPRPARCLSAQWSASEAAGAPATTTSHCGMTPIFAGLQLRSSSAGGDEGARDHRTADMDAAIDDPFEPDASRRPWSEHAGEMNFESATSAHGADAAPREPQHGAAESSGQGRYGCRCDCQCHRVHAALPRVMILPQISEQVLSTGDIGRPRDVLERLFASCLPEECFDPLGNAPTWWFNPQPVKKPNHGLHEEFHSEESAAHCRQRCENFLAWAQQRPEKVIVAVGHSTFWKCFQSRGGVASTCSLTNCELINLAI